MMYGGAAGATYGGAGMPYSSPVNAVKGFANPHYGNRDAFAQSSPFNRGMFFMGGQRKRMNVVAILLALFVPWLLFCFVFGVLSMKLHFTHPFLSDIMLMLGFVCVVCSAAYFAANAVKKKFLEPTYQPSWYVFIAATSFVAFVVALYAGEYNYVTYMQPYYDLQNLAGYKDIDTNAYLGQQLMDAGKIDFQAGTVLDISRSMGFKNHDVYCVAPIVTKNGSAKALSVDFWAVGKNCCSGVSADFHCSGFANPRATGVIRSMRDDERPFYRLAVQQAEATYKMTASHPLFFEWVPNAEEATNEFLHNGYFTYFVGITAYFLVQIFLTSVVTLAFSKLVHS